MKNLTNQPKSVWRKNLYDEVHLLRNVVYALFEEVNNI